METFSSAVTRRMKLVEYSTSRVTVAVTFMLPGRMPWNSTG